MGSEAVGSTRRLNADFLVAKRKDLLDRQRFSVDLQLSQFQLASRIKKATQHKPVTHPLEYMAKARQCICRCVGKIPVEAVEGPDRGRYRRIWTDCSCVPRLKRVFRDEQKPDFFYCERRREQSLILEYLIRTSYIFVE